MKAFEVDVYQRNDGRGDFGNVTDFVEGCDKMSLCGSVEQTKTITFGVKDNLERPDTHIVALIHMDEHSKELKVTSTDEPFVYEFSFAENTVGVGILEVFFDGEQIPESPFRVKIGERDCRLDFPGQGKSAVRQFRTYPRVPSFEGLNLKKLNTLSFHQTEDGSCQCNSETIEISGECMPSSTFAIMISTILFALASIAGYLFLRYKRRKSDELWLVSVEELHFSEPVEIIGQGSFGVVLLAEYR